MHRPRSIIYAITLLGIALTVVGLSTLVIFFGTPTIRDVGLTVSLLLGGIACHFMLTASLLVDAINLLEGLLRELRDLRNELTRFPR